LEGYAKALQEHGIPINKDYIKYCNHGGKDLDEIETSIDE